MTATAKYQIFYMLPSFFRDGSMGADWLREHGRLPTLATIHTTHALLVDGLTFPFDCSRDKALERVFCSMQAERWSPNGEARELIRSKGLEHTSMSVGDIIAEIDGNWGQLYIVDRFGFAPIGEAFRA